MPRPQRPFDVLIVEDEALLVMDLEAMIEDAGHAVVGEAASLSEFEALSQTLCPDVAFVDLQLAENSSGLDVCTRLKARWPDTAVVFVTANPRMIPDDFLGAHGVIAKPFSRSGLMAAMQFIEQGLSDPPPTMDRPLSFSASPQIGQAWNIA
ncbi:response regulator [Brevundimonas variabilis]|uniref:CheY-like chemotaxis protein n=1 Tax=Brevundimonas variabilis TaxID=74312 RepID=A0A7W9CF57_9CAUL|nr:response regulator [Brevundimonas variabilis]MBB5744518.1 CheY-like chemotaxis protein [Brevundimonas variabilis]